MEKRSLDRRFFVVWPLILVMALLVVGCNREVGIPTEATDEPAHEFETPQTLGVELLPADQQRGGSLAVRVVDAQGQPVTDATVRLEGDMNHAGMIPVISDSVEHEADGVYRVPFEFTMLGDWIISVYVTTAEGWKYDMQIELDVREDGIVIQ